MFPNQHYEIVFDFHELIFFYNKNINLCKMVGINLISYSISSDKILLRVVKWWHQLIMLMVLRYNDSHRVSLSKTLQFSLLWWLVVDDDDVASTITMEDLAWPLLKMNLKKTFELCSNHPDILICYVVLQLLPLHHLHSLCKRKNETLAFIIPTFLCHYNKCYILYWKPKK